MSKLNHIIVFSELCYTRYLGLNRTSFFVYFLWSLHNLLKRYFINTWCKVVFQKVFPMFFKWGRLRWNSDDNTIFMFNFWLKPLVVCGRKIFLVGVCLQANIAVKKMKVGARGFFIYLLLFLKNFRIVSVVREPIYHHLYIFLSIYIYIYICIYIYNMMITSWYPPPPNFVIELDRYIQRWW